MFQLLTSVSFKPNFANIRSTFLDLVRRHSDKTATRLQLEFSCLYDVDFVVAGFGNLLYFSELFYEHYII